MLGLVAGWILFPASNLLGGLALISAALVWSGAVGLVVAGFALAVTRWRRHRRDRSAPDSERATEPSTPIEGRWERTPVEQGDRRYVRTTVHVDHPCRPYVAGSGQRPRCEENRGGDFYTECDVCLNCDVPHEVAPDLMAYVQHPRAGSLHCVFTRQPRTPEEIERAIDAMCGSEVCGIRYGGRDPDILRRVAARIHPSSEGTADHQA